MLLVPERVSWNSLNLDQEKICTQGEKLKNFLIVEEKLKISWTVVENINISEQ